MTVYREAVMLLKFLVDWLLLMACNYICGYGPNPCRTVVGGLLGSAYAGVCLVPGFSFMGNFFWRFVVLALMAMAAYGMSGSALRRGAVFALLSMALGGMTLSMGGSDAWKLAGGAMGICVLCAVGLGRRLCPAKYVPVELTYGDMKLSVTALLDTGNTLRDPVTGGPVLVVDAPTASALTGLTGKQLCDPVDTMGAIPGLRLIPYRAVGTPNGLLLGMRLRRVRIGNWTGSTVVAFAPGELSSGAYQALTGGTA